MERFLLVVSNGFYFASFALTLFALGARTYRASRRNYVLILSGFVLQSAALQLRGMRTGHCPLTNAFEVLVFLSWSVALIYLLVGGGYRMSLLGAFTAPVVFLLQGLGLALPIEESASGQTRQTEFWLELHAALSIVAYGAFALAGVAGALFLMQERFLKTHRVTGIASFLPPMTDLGRMNARLMTFGLALLTLGLAAGFLVGRPTEPLKLAGGVLVWLLYAAILQLRWLKTLAPVPAARLSVAAFAASLASLWGFHLLPPALGFS